MRKNVNNIKDKQMKIWTFVEKVANKKLTTNIETITITIHE